MNVVALIGNLATDIELRDVPPDRKVATFLLAVDRPARDAGADFFRVSTWNRQAEVCDEYLSKGSKVGVDGRLRSRSWEDEDGKRRTRRRGASRTASSSSTRATRDGVALRGRRVIGSTRPWPAAGRHHRLRGRAARRRRVPEYGRPGLQVVGADEVSKLVCGVSSSRELFERAAARARSSCSSTTGCSGATSRCVVDRRLKGRLEALFAGEPDARRVPPRARRASGAREQRPARRAARREVEGPFAGIGVGGRASRAGRRSASSRTRLEAATGRAPLVFAEGPGANRARRGRDRRRRHAA